MQQEQLVHPVLNLGRDLRAILVGFSVSVHLGQKCFPVLDLFQDCVQEHFLFLHRASFRGLRHRFLFKGRVRSKVPVRPVENFLESGLLLRIEEGALGLWRHLHDGCVLPRLLQYLGGFAAAAHELNGAQAVVILHERVLRVEVGDLHFGFLRRRRLLDGKLDGSMLSYVLQYLDLVGARVLVPAISRLPETIVEGKQCTTCGCVTSHGCPRAR